MEGECKTKFSIEVEFRFSFKVQKFFQFPAFYFAPAVLYYPYGALAQLGARHTGSVEVTGSNPVCSIFLFFSAEIH